MRFIRLTKEGGDEVLVNLELAKTVKAYKGFSPIDDNKWIDGALISFGPDDFIQVREKPGDILMWEIGKPANREKEKGD
jgi:hypothetical protein